MGLAGNLSDFYGRRRVILLGLSIFTLFTWTIGFASSFYVAFLFRLVSGLGEGIFWPVAMAAVADLFGGRKGLALGVFYVGFDVGSTAGLSIGGLAYYLSGAWQQAFFIAPLVGIVAIVGVYFLKGLFVEQTGTRLSSAPAKAVLELLREKGVAPVMLFAFLATWASVWQVVFLPFYFSRVMHFSVISAALLSSAVALSGGVGKVILGWISDRWPRNRVLLLLSLAVCVAYGLFFLVDSLYLLVVAALGMGFLSSAIFPVMQALATDYSVGLAGTGMGLTTTFQSVATVFSPTIAGLLLQFGVGRALALDAMVPALLMTAVAFFVLPGRSSPNHSQSL